MHLMTGISLKNLRTYLGLSQEEFAEQFNLGDRNSVSKLEKSKVIPQDIVAKLYGQFNNEAELEQLLTELDGISQTMYSNNLSQKKGNGMTDQINSFLNQQFEKGNLMREETIKKLTAEKQVIEKELRDTNDKFIELSKRFDSLKFDFEIGTLKMMQSIKETLNEAQKYTDSSLKEFESDVNEQVSAMVKDLYQQTKNSETSSSGMAGIGLSLLDNLPEIIKVIATLRQVNPNMMMNQPGKAPYPQDIFAGMSDFNSFSNMENARSQQYQGMNRENMAQNPNNHQDSSQNDSSNQQNFEQNNGFEYEK